MKLLQINSTYNWGSTGRIAEEISQKVISYGWESYLAYGRGYNKGVSIPVKIGNQLDFYYHVLMTRLFNRHGLASKWATRKFIKQIERIKPDIIHLHNIHGYYLNYPMLFLYLSEAAIPIVWTLHDCWTFTGHCGYFSYIRCARWRIGCHDCPQKKNYPKSWWIDRSGKEYMDKLFSFTSAKKMVLVPVSEWLAGEVKQSFLKNYPMRVIHNGVDVDTFRPLQINEKHKAFEHKFVILGIASIWSPRKGLFDFIKLRKKLSDDYLIVLIGLSEKQIRKLPKNIVGICRTNSIQELASYYSLADVFFNPTWEDNFPTTNLEALACGTPLITYKTGGSVEAVDKTVGFVVEQGDLDRTVELIKTMKEQGKRLYTNYCRERAVLNYDKRSCYESYFQLYKELLNKNS